MAKKKLTIEDVLVPKEEIPYEVPENWCWVKLGSVSNVISGGTPRTTVEEYYKDGNIPWITPADLSNYNNIYIGEGRRSITQLGLDNSSAKLLPTDSILLSSRAPIGYVAIAERPLATNQGFKCFEPSSVYLAKYAYWYLKSATSLIESFGSGTTFKEVSAKKAALIPMPIPPLHEQERIVNRIESLFDKVDKAAELVDDARDGFEKRRAAILARCLRGEFTQSTNQVNIDNSKLAEGFYEIPNNWKWIRLKDLCEKITDGTHKSPKSYEEGEYKYITAKNIKEWGIYLNNITYITEEDHRVIYNRCDVKEGDVLYIKDGATTGIATINDLEEEFSLLSSVALIRVNEILDNRYLKYVLNSYEIKKSILDSVKGVAITRLTLKKINDIVIPVPPINEQKEIVNILDKIIEEENEVYTLSNINQIVDNIKKAILAKAFRGEIGSNDLNENINILR